MALMPVTHGVVQLLALLARGADPVEFERPVVEARAEGLATDDIAALEDAKRSALEVRSQLEVHRRREAELAALFQTASDLAALSSVDDVLSAIVRRARTLLGRDVAYLCLNDEAAGDTYMRVTDGSVSAAFQRVRLPLGAGLGGMVAQQGVPFTSTNYLTDDRVAHTSDIDNAVIDEGLVSIRGVPLKLGATVIGVLFAADRQERAFSRDEVALLSSLAAHAAVALDNARLLAETRDALNSLEQANSALRQQSKDTELAVRAHDRLAELVLRGGGVSEVAAELSELLDGEVTVAVPAPQAAAAGPGVTSVPVVAGSEVLGELVLTRGGTPRAADLRVLERGALVTALLLLFSRQVADAANRGRRDLLEDLLLDAALDRSEVAARAVDLDVDVDAPMVVLVCATPRHRTDSEQAAAFLAARHRGLSAHIAGSIVLLLPGSDAGATAREVSVTLGRSLGGPVTVAGQAAGSIRHSIGSAPGTGAGMADAEAVDQVDVLRLPAAYATARDCLAAMLALGRAGQGATMTDLGFVGVVLTGGRSGADFVADTLGAVLDYDAARGTDLAVTLDEYFGAGAHLARTAERLHVHPNTVGQRLSRIGTLLGADWTAPERTLQIQLALQLRAVLHTRPD
jgi:DNA-binding PucR family transcriptional regulator